MKSSNTIPNFRLRRQHGQCPSCDHSGRNCRCHRWPKKAAAVFARRQIEVATHALATAQKIVAQYHLENSIPILLSSDAESTYVDAGDRFIVSFTIGLGAADGVTTPQEAVGAALEFITSDDGAPDTHWQCRDRTTGVLHIIKQNDAQISQ